MVIPKAVPTAGGCSVSVIAIMKKLKPTANAYHNPEKNNQSEKGKIEKQIPTKKPIVCPPIILFGSDVTLLGIEKTIKAVAPILAIITSWSSLSISVISNTVIAA